MYEIALVIEEVIHTFDNNILIFSSNVSAESAAIVNS
jgi:hypothetical protein